MLANRSTFPGKSLTKRKISRSNNPAPAAMTKKVTVKQAAIEEGEALSPDTILPTCQALLSSLLTRGRNLRIEMTRSLLDNETEHVSGSSHRQSRDADAIRTAWSIDPLAPGSELTFEERMIDLVLGDRMTSIEVGAVNAMSQSQSLISSDEEIDDNSLPIEEEEALRNLLFVKKVDYAEKSRPNKAEEMARRTPTVKWNYGVTKDGKYRPPLVRPRSTTNDARKKLTMPYKRIVAKPFQEPTNQKPPIDRTIPDDHFLEPKFRDVARDFDRPITYADEAQDRSSKILHCLLSIPEGKDFDLFYQMACNSPDNELNSGLFLISRLLCTGNASRSEVCSNLSNPRFSFKQLTAVLVTPTLLSSMRNNVMVVEVWWRSLLRPNQDKLIGLCKLPLHLFYLSLHNSDVANTFLWRQQLIVAVDEFLPVIDVFSQRQVGCLKVFLAMGHVQQEIETASITKSSPSIESKPISRQTFQEFQGLPNRKSVSFVAEVGKELQTNYASSPPESATTTSIDVQNSSTVLGEANSILLKVAIEHGIGVVVTQRGGSGSTLYKCCVSVSLAPFDKDVVSDFVDFIDDPQWNWSKDIRFSVAVLCQQNMLHDCLTIYDSLLKGLTVPEDENAINIGFTTVDASPLLSGMKQLCGYYNIMDFEGLCKGQLKISVEPLSSLNYVHTVIEESTHISGKPLRAPSYVTAGLYSEFPSHVMRFAEQKVRLCEPLPAAENILVNMNNEESQNIASDINADYNSESSLTDCSRSFLISSLSAKLSELDTFTKLATERLENPDTAYGLSLPTHGADVPAVQATFLESGCRFLSTPTLGLPPQPVRKRKSRLAAALFGNSLENNS